MRRLLAGIRSADGQLAFTLVYTAAILTALEYFYLPPRVQVRLGGGGAVSLEAGVTWALGSTVGYMVLPAIFLLLFHRERPADMGYRLRGIGRHVWIYLGLYLCVLPLVLFAAGRPDFARTYPFVADARHNWIVFWKWELSYLLQFFALESFFRGYLLFQLEKRIGWNAIFVMAVPYCMIHYHKPWMEAYAAIGAGLLLGALALRLRSFYGGAVLHMLVGLTMDLLGAHRSGLF